MAYRASATNAAMPLAKALAARFQHQDFVRRYRKNSVAVVGLVLLIGMILVAIFAPTIAPYDPYEMHFTEKLRAPSAKYWLGTDEFGRDVLSRVIHGSRISLYVGFLTVVIGCLIGTIIGLVSGYAGGWVDNIAMRIVDIMFAFPSILLAIAIMAFLGSSVNNVIIAVSIVNIPRFARNVRGPVLSVKEKEFIEAARAVGAGHLRIMFRHVLPNVTAPLIVAATVSLGFAILAESSLSFLGLGTQPPTPSWGVMLSTAKGFMEIAPWMATFPGLAIMAVVLSINFVGDGLRDVLDPRLKT